MENNEERIKENKEKGKEKGKKKEKEKEKEKGGNVKKDNNVNIIDKEDKN